MATKRTPSIKQAHKADSFLKMQGIAKGLWKEDAVNYVKELRNG